MSGSNRSGAAVPLPEAAPRIRRVRLQTHVLGRLRRFYHETIGFEIVVETRETLTLQAGASQIMFEQASDGSEPYYHFAFNIPENLIAEARQWLSARVPLLRHAESGADVIAFDEWHAHALFCSDPAGNLVELIARHSLRNASNEPFDVRQILYMSEIGIVPPAIEPAIQQIQSTFAIGHYLGQRSFLGDERGIIILIDPQYRWMPEQTKGGVMYPAEVAIAGHGAGICQIADTPLTIVGIA
jgi:hypothetical protein